MRPGDEGAARPGAVAHPDPTVERLRRYAHVMDAAVRIPGTSIRVGLDSVLGLLPGGGDLAGAVLAGAVVLAAARRGAPAAVLGRMTWNVVVDTVLGAVPLLGDLFDVGWKANLRNVELLEGHVGRPEPTRKASRGTLVAVAAAFTAILVLLAVGAFVAVRGVLGLLF